MGNKLTRSKRTNYINTLPPELVRLIFCYLSDEKGFHRLRLVSKLWNVVIAEVHRCQVLKVNVELNFDKNGEFALWKAGYRKEKKLDDVDYIPSHSHTELRIRKFYRGPEINNFRVMQLIPVISKLPTITTLYIRARMLDCSSETLQNLFRAVKDNVRVIRLTGHYIFTSALCDLLIEWCARLDRLEEVDIQSANIPNRDSKRLENFLVENQAKCSFSNAMFLYYTTS